MIALGLILVIAGFVAGYYAKELQAKVPHQGNPCPEVAIEEIKEIAATEPDIKKHVKSKRKR